MTSVKDKMTSVEASEPNLSTLLGAAYTATIPNADEIISALRSRDAEFQELEDLVEGVKGFNESTNTEDATKIQNANYYTSNAIKYNSYNEALKAVFFALLTCVIILVILATGIINITIATIGMVLALTIAIIYASTILVTGVSQSSTLPGIFTWDFNFKNKKETFKQKKETFEPYYKDENLAYIGIKAV